MTSSPTTPFDRRTRLVLALLSAVVFMAVVNGTMINVALPHIGRDFGVSEGTYGWLVTGYSLTFGIFNAINGRLADIVGARRIYMMGLVALGACSLAVALAPTIEVAIGIRLVQGAGAAALPVIGTTMVKRVVAPNQQGAAVGVILAVVGVAASIGPFLGGFIVQYLGWRAVFMVTGLSLLAIPAVLRILPPDGPRKESRFDVVGATLLGVGVAALLYGFELLESRAPLWQLAASIGGGGALLGAFYAWIRKVDAPFVPPSLFSIPSYLAICVVGAVANATRFSSVILAAIYLDEVNHLSPILVGAVLFPGALAVATLSRRAGALADSHGPRTPVVAGVVLSIVGALAAAATAGGSPILNALALGIFGAGYAAAQSPLVATVNRIVPARITGAGVGLFMTIFFAGGAAGVAGSVTAIELQGDTITQLLPLGSGLAPRFSNTFVGLAILSALSLVPAMTLPARSPD